MSLLALGTTANANDERYIVDTTALSCNETPSPCYHESCRVTTYQRGDTLRLSGYEYDTRGVRWGIDHYNGCWVSTKYLKLDHNYGNNYHDITYINYQASYIVNSPDGEMNCRRQTNYSDNVLTVLPNGEQLTLMDIVFDYQGKPWLEHLHIYPSGRQRSCFMRANTKYIREIF